MRQHYLALACFVTICALAPLAHAQLSIPGASTALTITLTPGSPRPGETVRLQVSSTLYDLRDSDITWRSNGTVIAEGVGETEASVVAGDLGSVTTISVSTQTEEGIASSGARVVPASIDLLWEADSYTPAFYRGRALAGPGTTVRVVAIPHLVRTDGTEVPSSQITYTWRKNGTVLGSLSGRGRSTLSTASPFLDDTDLISVEAISTDRTISATNSIRIGTAATPLRIYQNHPLFGRLSHQALPASTFIPEAEMAFEAIPFFANVRTLRDRALEYDWEVNRVSVAPDAAAPNTITINAEGSTGIANVQLSILHANNLFFNAEGAWSIHFRSAGIEGGSDPFRATE